MQARLQRRKSQRNSCISFHRILVSWWVILKPASLGFITFAFSAAIMLYFSSFSQPSDLQPRSVTLQAEAFSGRALPTLSPQENSFQQYYPQNYGQVYSGGPVEASAIVPYAGSQHYAQPNYGSANQQPVVYYYPPAAPSPATPSFTPTPTPTSTVTPSSTPAPTPSVSPTPLPGEYFQEFVIEDSDTVN